MFAARAALVLTLLLQAGVGPRGQTPASRNRLLLDEAHHNLYAAASGGYRSFVQLVTDAGFSVTRNSGPFSLARLAAADILPIANPNGAGASASVEERARLDVGRGRVVVGGEMGVLTDYSVREADNRRFALNIVRWLSRER